MRRFRILFFLNLLSILLFCAILILDLIFNRPDYLRSFVVSPKNWLENRQNNIANFVSEFFVSPLSSIEKLATSPIKINIENSPIIEEEALPPISIVPDNTYPDIATKLITSAKKSINIFLYHLTVGEKIEPLINALVDAKRRGVRVDVILADDVPIRDVNYRTMQKLSNIGILCRIENRRVMHSKAIFVDDEYMLAGSHNWSHSAFYDNAEMSLLIHDTRFAVAAKSELVSALEKITVNKPPEQIIKKHHIYVNINETTEEILQLLPGIGPKTAKEIIRYGKEHHGFKTPEELMKVPGISPKLYNSIKESILISWNDSRLAKWKSRRRRINH